MKLPSILPIRLSVAACISLSLIWPSGCGTALAIDWSQRTPTCICQMPWLNETADIYPFDCDGGYGTICANSPWRTPAAPRSAAHPGPACQDDFDGCWQVDAARFGYADDDPGLAPDFHYGFPATHDKDPQPEATVVSLAAPADEDREIASHYRLLIRPIRETVDIWFNVWRVVSQLLNDQTAGHDVLVANISDLTDGSQTLSGQDVVTELNAENDGLIPNNIGQESIVTAANPSFDALQVVVGTANGESDQTDSNFYCEYGYGCEYGYDSEFAYEAEENADLNFVEDAPSCEQTDVVAVDPAETSCDAVREFDHFESVIEGPSRYVFLRTEASIAAANHRRLQHAAAAPAVGESRSDMIADDVDVESDESHFADAEMSADWQSYPEACLADAIVPDEHTGEACGIDGAASNDVEQPWPFTYDNQTGWHRTEDYPCIDANWLVADETNVPELPTIDLRPFLRPGLMLAAGILEQWSRSLQLASDELRQVAGDLAAPSDDEGTTERSARHVPFDGTHVGL